MAVFRRSLFREWSGGDEVAILLPELSHLLQWELDAGKVGQARSALRLDVVPDKVGVDDGREEVAGRILYANEFRLAEAAAAHELTKEGGRVDPTTNLPSPGLDLTEAWGATEDAEQDVPKRFRILRHVRRHLRQ